MVCISQCLVQLQRVYFVIDAFVCVLWCIVHDKNCVWMLRGMGVWEYGSMGVGEGFFLPHTHIFLYQFFEMIVHCPNQHTVGASLVDALGRHKTCPYDAQ